VLNAPVDGVEAPVHERHVVTKMRGRIINVSAGGFAVVVPQAIPSQVLIRVTLEFDLLVSQPVSVDARMVASTPLAGGRYLVRATYFGVDEETRDIIARYVMHRQQAYLEASTPAE
jgi:c-di-GMP-binding flagellar brake protein YcgR